MTFEDNQRNIAPGFIVAAPPCSANCFAITRSLLKSHSLLQK
jgi:hypothetical protein